MSPSTWWKTTEQSCSTMIERREIPSHGFRFGTSLSRCRERTYGETKKRRTHAAWNTFDHFCRQPADRYGVLCIYTTIDPRPPWPLRYPTPECIITNKSTFITVHLLDPHWHGPHQTSIQCVTKPSFVRGWFQHCLSFRPGVPSHRQCSVGVVSMLGETVQLACCRPRNSRHARNSPLNSTKTSLARTNDRRPRGDSVGM